MIHRQNQVGNLDVIRLSLLMFGGWLLALKNEWKIRKYMHANAARFSRSKMSQKNHQIAHISEGKGAKKHPLLLIF